MDKIELESKALKENLRYDPETGHFWWTKPGGVRRKISEPAGHLDESKYVKINFNGSVYRAHRLAFLFMGQEVPKQVDHINGIRNDNRWCNLRASCHFTNSFNKGKQPSNTSGYKGVSWDSKSGKWLAQISVRNKKICLGRYDDLETAYEVYCKSADKYHKEYANYG